MTNPDRKAEIRKRAAEVFADQGYDRASIRDVGRATGMSLAGLYYYYRGKDELLFDIQYEAFRTLLERHQRVLANIKDPVEKIRSVIDAHLTFFAENIPEMKVISRESEQLTGEYARKVDELKRTYVRLVKGILGEIGGAMPLKEIPTGIAALILFGMMNWVYTWYDPDRDGSAADLSGAVREIFLNGYLRGS